ncbi:DUF4145 domain-containing protein [Pantoea sp. SIMBA_133]
MKVNPTPFTAFTESGCPDWRCPSCLNQTLKIKEGTFHFDHSAESRKRLSKYGYDVFEVSYVFSCLLECTKLGCLETVAVNGKGWCEELATRGPGGIENEDFNYFRGLSFTPPLPLFAVPDGCPDEIEKQLKVISSLLTVNPAAAANAIRHLLEILMNVMDVPDAKNLHRRIQKSLDKFGDDTAAIHVLRAVGNAGSHGNEITIRDLEEACLVLETVVKKFCHAAPDISHIVERLEAAFNVRKQQ